MHPKKKKSESFKFSKGELKAYAKLVRGGIIEQLKQKVR